MAPRFTTLDLLTHESKVMLYVIGVMDDLKRHGLVEGGHDISDEGRETLEQLRASGFKPTDDEMQAAVRVLRRGKR